LPKGPPPWYTARLEARVLAYIPYPTWLTSEIIPGLPIRWYGLMYLVAFVISYLLFLFQARQRKLDTDKDKDTILNMFFWAIVGLLAGARIFATVLFSGTDLYVRQPWLIFWPFSAGKFVGLQGMNYYGGLLGAAVAIVLYGRVKKLPVRDWGDMLLAGVPLGYTFGRLGNFINGELYGRVTSLPWGMVFPHAEPLPVSDPFVRETAARVGIALAAGAKTVNLPRHPTQLYEAFLEGIVLWALLWFVFRKRRPFKGFIIGAYVLGYGLFRFLVDYVRMPLVQGFTLQLSALDNPTYRFLTPLNIIDSQILSFLMILTGVALLVIFGLMGRAEAARGAQDAHKPDPRKLRKKLAK
jgi:phosphatidylglycerol---prolipoprotein diacylglyceryl transferase